jgi:hypothetical protein
MTQTPSAGRSSWRISDETREEDRVSDARARHRAQERNAGWVRFASLMLVLIGVFQIVTGLSVIFRRQTFLVPENRLLVDVDYAAYGWLYIVLGVLALAAAYGVEQRASWARVTGIVLAVLSAVSNLGFLPVRPFTAATVIVLNVLAIYGIAVHGSREGTRFYVDRA